MWNYLKKYNKNPYWPKLAPTNLLIPDFGRADLLPSTPLIGTLLILLRSPSLQPPTFPTRGEGSDTDLFASHKHVQEQASTATSTPTTHPLFLLPFTILELTTQIQKLFPDKSSGPSGITNRMLQAGDAEFQALLLMLFNGLWDPTCNLQTGNSPSCNTSTKGMTKARPTLPLSEEYGSMSPRPNSLKVSS